MSVVSAPPPVGSLRPSNFTTLPLWCLVALPLTCLPNLRLLLTYDPLTRAITYGSNLAKEQALGIPALLIAIVIAWLVATATATWLISDFALAALR